MRTVLRFLLKVLTACVAIAFLGSIVLAQLSCPFMACKGPDLDAWMPPFALSFVGLPALSLAAMFVVQALAPTCSALCFFRCAAIATFFLPFIAAAAVGIAFSLIRRHTVG